MRTIHEIAKKMFVIALVLALSLGSACADDQVDAILAMIAELDYYQVGAVSAWCRVRLIETGGEGYILDPGTYIVGEDIPDGSWTMAVDKGLTTVVLYPDAETAGTRMGWLVMHAISASATDRIGKITFEDGQAVEITGSQVKVQPYAGVQRITP